MSAQTYPARLEHALLGMCLLEPDVFKKASCLTRADFTEENAIVFEVGLGLAMKGLASDAISVALELRRLGKLEVAGGEEYILNLIADRAAEDPRRANKFIKDITEWSARRHASSAAQNHALALMNSAVPLDRALDAVRSTVSEASEALGADEFEPLGAMSEALIEGWRSPDRNPGLPTGFAQLDEQINSGLRPGQLVVIAGDTGSGKSSLASQIALTAAHAAKVNPGKFGAPEGKSAPVLIFSYEMSKEEIYERMVAQRSPVSDSFRAPRGWLSTDLPLAEEGARVIADLPLFVFDENGATVEDVRSTVERFSAIYGRKPALVVVDYIGLMNMPGTTNRVEVISHITRSLKAMAREMHIPIIALAQINREAGKRVSHRPGLTDLRESGSIEQDANIVLLVYRESYYIVDPEAKKAAEDGNPDVEVIVAKNRSGRSGSIKMRWLGRRYLFVPDPSWVSSFGAPMFKGRGIIEFPILTAPVRSQTDSERAIEAIGTHCDQTQTKCDRAVLIAAFGNSPKSKWGEVTVGHVIDGLVKSGQVRTATEGVKHVYWLPGQFPEVTSPSAIDADADNLFN